MSRILKTPLLVFSHRCRVGLYSIFKTGAFKSYLPVFYPFDEIRHPFLGGSRIDIKNNRLLWLHQLAALVALNIFGPGLQTPPFDEAYHLYTVRIRTVVRIALREITDPLV